MSQEEKGATSDKESEGKGSDGGADFGEAFKAFAVFGDRVSDEGAIALKNIDKWLKQAGILDGKQVTNADTAITFSKVAKFAKRIDQEGFESFLEQLASDKGLEKSDLMARLASAKEPDLGNVTTTAGGSAGSNVERMTDTSLYTGAHKERFDAEGKGRGIEGRTDTDSSDGYVSGYKRDDSKK